MHARTATLALTTLALASSAALAQYAITRSTIDGGGGKLTGSTYTLNGTVGQPDAVVLTGSTYTLKGGFWGGGFGTPCPGDIDGSNTVNLADFNILAVNFGNGPGATLAQGDLNGDGFVNLADFNILAVNFGSSCP